MTRRTTTTDTEPLGDPVPPILATYYDAIDDNRFEDAAATFATQGVRLAFGSDSPVTRFDRWGAVRAAVEHHEAGQRLDVATALTAHTAGGHEAAREDGGGVLRIGGPATFAAWHAPDTDTDNDGLPEVRDGSALPSCRLTVRDGTPLLTP